MSCPNTLTIEVIEIPKTNGPTKRATRKSILTKRSPSPTDSFLSNPTHFKAPLPTCEPEQKIPKTIAVAVQKNNMSNLLKIRNIFSGTTVCIDGNIAVGKTTFARNLAFTFSSILELNVTILEEQTDEFVRKQFNENPAEWAYLFQLVMMSNRLKMSKQADMAREENRVVIIDTGLTREIAFSKANMRMGNIKPEDFNSHMKTFERAHTELGSPMPDFIIHLEASSNRCISNINKRQIANDHLLKEDYLSIISEEYRNSTEHPMLKGKTKFITIDVNDNYASEVFRILEIIADQIDLTE